MDDAPRGPRALDAAMPLLVAASWTFHGLFALDSGHAVSGKALLGWVSFFAAGIGLGAAIAILGQRRALRLGRTAGTRRPGVARPVAQPMFFLMFGLVQVSMGVEVVSDGPLSWGDWSFLAFTSGGGGAFVGAAVAMRQFRIDRVPTPQETTAGS